MTFDKTAIGYGVYCPARDTWLGKLGAWYTDVRLASVYAEPRSAKMAIGRQEVQWTPVVVPITLSVRSIDLQTAADEANALERDGKKGEPIIPNTPTARPAPKTTAKAG